MLERWMVHILELFLISLSKLLGISKISWTAMVGIVVGIALLSLLMYHRYRIDYTTPMLYSRTLNRLICVMTIYFPKGWTTELNRPRIASIKIFTSSCLLAFGRPHYSRITEPSTDIIYTEILHGIASISRSHPPSQKTRMFVPYGRIMFHFGAKILQV